MKVPMTQLLLLAVSAIDVPSLMQTGVSFLAQTEEADSSDDIAVCPGEGLRYGDRKCNHDPTHRVCAQLLDAQSK